MRRMLTTVTMIVLVLASTSASNAAEVTPSPLSTILVSRFTVHVDGCATDLGSWSKVSGLGTSWIISARDGGDASNHRWYLPGVSRLSTVTLTRAAGAHSELVKDWLSDAATSFRTTTVTITLIGLAGQPPTTWTLSRALPTKWSVTGFDAGASKTILETLEFSHDGIAPAPACSPRAS